MGSLNFKLYLLSVHSQLYSHNKGWQESLGSELIFIPTIAVHTNQHPCLIFTALLILEAKNSKHYEN